MGRHRARPEAPRDRAPAGPRDAGDPLRLTPWRGIAGILVPAVFLSVWSIAADVWRSAPGFVVLCATEIVLLLLAFAPWRPAPWVDRWHGRLLVVGSILSGCASAVFVPVAVVSFVRLVLGIATEGRWAWLALSSLVLAGPLLVGTTSVYWRVADGLARRAFAAGPAFPRRELERTFE